MVNSFYEWKNRIESKETLRVCRVEGVDGDRVKLDDGIGFFEVRAESGFVVGDRVLVFGGQILQKCPDLQDGGVVYV